MLRPEYICVLLTQQRLGFNCRLIMLVTNLELLLSINQNPTVMGVCCGWGGQQYWAVCVWGICLIDSFLFQLVKAIKVYGKGQCGGVSLHTHTYIHPYVHTYVHTYTHTHTHTHTHTYTKPRLQLQNYFN